MDHETALITLYQGQEWHRFWLAGIALRDMPDDQRLQVETAVRFEDVMECYAGLRGRK